MTQFYPDPKSKWQVFCLPWVALPPSGCTRSWRRCPGRVGRRSRRDCYLSGSSRIRAPSGPASGPRPGSSPGRTRLRNTARKTIKRYSDKRIIAHLSKTRIKHSFFVVFLLFFSVVLGYTTRLIFSSRCYLTDNWLSLRCFDFWDCIRTGVFLSWHQPLNG